MSAPNSKERQVRNEQLLRKLNTKASKAIKDYFGDKTFHATEMPLDFNCECSNLACGDSVTMPIKRYEKLHARKDHFVLVKGHESTTVEKIVDDLGEYVVVEKFALEP